MWTMRHQIRRVSRGKILRVILADAATIPWSADGWKTTNKIETCVIEALHLYYADFPTENLREGAALEFTFFWKKSQKWEGRNFAVTIE